MCSACSFIADSGRHQGLTRQQSRGATVVTHDELDPRLLVIADRLGKSSPGDTRHANRSFARLYQRTEHLFQPSDEDSTPLEIRTKDYQTQQMDS